MINDLSMSEMLREFWWRLSWVALLVDMKWILNPVKFLEDPSGNGSGVHGENVGPSDQLKDRTIAVQLEVGVWVG